MSNGKWHVIGALAVTFITLLILAAFVRIEWWLLPLCAVIVYYYSRLPDIDHESSSITWEMLAYGAFITLYGLLYKYVSHVFKYDVFMFGVVVLLLTIFFALLKHRGITHTIWFALASPLLLLLLPEFPHRTLLMFIALVACYTHLVMDGYILKTNFKPEKGMW